MISSDAHFKKPELTYNLTTTKFQLPMSHLETGKMYYVRVSLVDDGKYVSSPAGPIILETPVPAKDMIGEKMTDENRGLVSLGSWVPRNPSILRIGFQNLSIF